MQFCDLLRMTVLLAAGGATALAVITAVSANADLDTTTLIVAAIWWTAAFVIGLILGRPARAADAMRPLLAEAKTTPTLPTENPNRVALARLWPLGAFALVAGRPRHLLSRGLRRRHRLRDRGRSDPPRLGSCGRRDRGTRRRPLLRRAGLGAHAGDAHQDAGPAARPAARRTPARSRARAPSTRISSRLRLADSGCDAMRGMLRLHASYALCRFRSGANERHARVFATCSLVSQARRAVATE